MYATHVPEVHEGWLATRTKELAIESAGAHRAGLGGRILRVETAAVAAASLLLLR